MENNKNTVDLIQILLWALPILLAIPVGIATNIITPRFQNWLATRSLSNASKRKNEIKSEFESVVYFHKNMQKLYLKSANIVFLILFSIVVGTILSSFGNFLSIAYFYFFDYTNRYGRVGDLLFGLIQSAIILISTIPYLAAAIIAMNHIRLISRIENIEEYKKNVNTQIKKIEAKHHKKTAEKEQL